MYILNAFSLNMVSAECLPDVRFAELSLHAARELVRSDVDVVSGVGHVETASVFTDILGIPVSYARTNVVLGHGTQAVIGQYSGRRLPEGATFLPEGASIRWVLVTVS
jgi:hypothetical protein